MGMSIRTNQASINAQNNIFKNEDALNTSLARLSSGFRITKAGDDAAGLAISSQLGAQVRSYNQASRNASDGLSVIQTAEAALNETTNVLTRLRELAMQSSSSGVSNTERAYIQNEVDALTSEIDRIAKATEFNGTKLLDNGTSAVSLTFQVGIRNSSATTERISVQAVSATAGDLGVSGLSLSSAASSQAALATIDTALDRISSSRAKLGTAGNRLTSATSSIRTAAESLSAAASRIRDVDVAEETSALSRAQILMQAGVSVLAQANQQPQMALKLLG